MYSDKYSEVVGRNLSDLLEKNGRTQNELANYLKVSKAIVSLWCSGKSQMRDKHYDGVCAFLHCSKSDLLLDKSNPDLLYPASYSVPMLGNICAGNGIICEEDYQGQFFIDSSIKADYCLKVKGDSMSPVIKNGDIAFIQKNYEFTNGDVYAVIIEDEVLLKQAHRSKDRLLLSSFNNNYEPIMVTDAFIIGKCIGYYSPLL